MVRLNLRLLKHKKSYPAITVQFNRFTTRYIDVINRTQRNIEYTKAYMRRHKVVTYPRTDSNHLTTDMVDTMKERGSGDDGNNI